MAFTVETGDGLADANSYVAVADADSYHVLRNNTTWASLTNTVKQAALVYATAYVDANFSWPGRIVRDEQALSWPRNDARDDEERLLTGLPRKLTDAVCELALIHASTEAVNTTYERGGAVKKESVGPVSVEYFDGGPGGVTYPFLVDMLSAITLGGAGPGTVVLVRA